MKKILILNGSPSGKRGNCAQFIDSFLVKPAKKTFAPGEVVFEIVHLREKSFSKSLQKKLLQADGFIFATGTYWDSWGHPLQKLLEEMTDLEGAPEFMGKPAAVFVLKHSVGGKGILSRLQGVLSTYGCLIPPMSGMVYSLVSDIALKGRSSHAADFWQKEDAQLILQNLIKACGLNIQWAEWPVDKKDPRRQWLK